MVNILPKSGKRLACALAITSLGVIVFASTIVGGLAIGVANAQQMTPEGTASTIRHVQPLPILTSEEDLALVEVAKSHLGLKAWSADNWQHITTDFLGTEEPSKWTHAIIHLKLPSTAKAQKFCENGWEAMVKINLETKGIEDATYPTASSQCVPVDISELGRPDDGQQIGYSLIPRAYALTTSNGFAIARQDDLDDSIFDSYYGNLAYLKTPSISSTIYTKMDGFVAFLLNAEWTSGHYTQIGWEATSFATSCGVPASSKKIVYADNSVYSDLCARDTGLTWSDGAILLAEHICQGNGKYGQEISYNGNTWGHFTNVSCTTKQTSNIGNNSVFFENSNTSAKPASGWAPYITSSVTADDAYEAKNSVSGWVKWTASANKDKSCSGTVNSSVITGSLANFGLATWSSLSNTPARNTC